MKAYKVELLVVDHDGIGAKGVTQELENARFGNRCISPQVMKVDERDVGEWDDSHPLNMRSQAPAEYQRLFASLRESVSVTLTETDRSDLRVAANIIDRDGPSPIGVELSATLRRIASAGVALSRVPSARDILGAVARGWTHGPNQQKEMDPDLAVAIAAEVSALIDGVTAVEAAQSKRQEHERQKLIEDLAYRAAYWRQPGIGECQMKDVTEDFAQELDRAVAALRTAGVRVDAPTQPFTFHWLVELRPAFDGHPHFEATYYAGWMEHPLEPAKTLDPMAAARFARKEDAERVAAKLGHTLSCVWKAVEHGFAAVGVTGTRHDTVSPQTPMNSSHPDGVE